MKKLIVIPILTLMLILRIGFLTYGNIPYNSLYYDGSVHDYATEKIYININGELMDYEDLPMQPIRIDGSRTLVPLREVFETLGATVEFDPATDTVTIVDGTNTVTMTVDSKLAYVNGSEIEMDVAPKYVSINSTSEKKVMIPLRFVGESLGYEVTYDSSQRLVTVNNQTDMNATKLESSDAITITQTTDSFILNLDKSKVDIPSSFDISTIIHQDKYMENKYELIIPLSSNLFKTNIEVNNSNLLSIDILPVNTDSTKFVFNGNTVLYVDVIDDSENITLTVKSARDVYDKIIVVDAGHGGIDQGSVGTVDGTEYYEKDLVYDMANKTAEFIEVDSRFKVYLSRPEDIYIEPYGRSGLSSTLNADMFISIHINESATSASNGIETNYFDIEKSDKNYLDSKGIYVTEDREVVSAKSNDFANEIQKNLIEATVFNDRKVKHNNFAVLISNEVPAILIETGFISNYHDALNLIDDTYRTKVARTIADVVIEYYDKY